MDDIKQGLFAVALCLVLWPVRRWIVRFRTGVDTRASSAGQGLRLQAESALEFIGGFGLALFLGGLLATRLPPPLYEVHWAFREVGLLVASASFTLALESLRRHVAFPRVALFSIVGIWIVLVALAAITANRGTLASGGLWGIVAAMTISGISLTAALTLARKPHDARRVQK